ncbi:MAG: ECF transporter S component [Peptostreptococcaceae bacterium]|nr:ECF transporter S component [Peptostreptococcaceae bacterium]
MNTNPKTVKLTKLAMLAAISLVFVALIRIPIFPAAPYLTYDPADIPIFISAFAFGPLAGLSVTAVVAFIQAFVLAGDGFIGFLMHFFATGSFVIVAGLIYKNHKTKKSAAIALICGTIVMTTTMIGLNLIITPIFYLSVPIEAVIAMILPILLPFNLLKAGVNSAITFFIYKAIAKHLHK